ncbi:hypothetical protein DMB38_19960 [Streptomyces sp. WAC 06738]|uniref:hypothetical protein n=1 Tax=Streptomyces sp. WAC 06738 TaxID=2203210 RepID=UPI000F6F37CD|nr:hypothetical protein [Streptomyces sp. WAC 06738]AZM47753.1 hypothetical protein DMB38_19960 [Streptomyces sp. WAC 06738]
MLAAVMVVEGILRTPEGEGHYDTGWSLYQALAKNTRLYLLSAVWTEEQSRLWLAKRELRGHINYIHQPAAGPAGRLEALERLRSWRVGLVLEPDPTCAAAELDAGWNTAVITHAAYSQPQWRPDYPGTPRPWDDLTEAVERQTELRLTPHRTEQP